MSCDDVIISKIHLWTHVPPVNNYQNQCPKCTHKKRSFSRREYLSRFVPFRSLFSEPMVWKKSEISAYFPLVLKNLFEISVFFVNFDMYRFSVSLLLHLGTRRHTHIHTQNPFSRNRKFNFLIKNKKKRANWLFSAFHLQIWAGFSFAENFADFVPIRSDLWGWE